MIRATQENILGFISFFFQSAFQTLSGLFFFFFFLFFILGGKPTSISFEKMNFSSSFVLLKQKDPKIGF